MTTLLIIEDDPDIRVDMEEILSYEGFEILTAPNGFEGVLVARENLPDLIISDIMMPEMDGHEVLETLRQDSETATIPFIFVTAKSTRQDRIAGMALGADDYLPKPFTHTELLSTIQSCLEKRAILETTRIQQFAHRLISMQDEERQQIANTLQHQLLQPLNSLKMMLSVNTNSQPAPHLAMVDQMTEQLNSLIFQIYPTMLEHLGLLSALLWQIEHFTSKIARPIEFEHSGLDQTFPPQFKIAIFRVIQEILNTIEKYFPTSQLALRVWVEEELFNIEVVLADVAVNAQQVFEAQASAEFLGLQERVVALYGQLTFHRDDEQSFLIIRIPLRQPDSMSFPSISVAQQNPAKNVTIHQSEEESTDCIRIALAETHDIVREGLKRVLNTDNQLTIVAETAHSKGVLRIVEDLCPEIILLDIGLAGDGNLELVQHIARQYPDTQVIILSDYVDETFVMEAVRQGAQGYIAKNISAHELIHAIHEVDAGGRYLSKPLANEKLTHYIQEQSQDNPALDALSTLTSREREIFKLVVEGKTSAEVADIFVISRRTVETHRANLMRKLGVRRQADLIRFAMQYGVSAH